MFLDDLFRKRRGQFRVVRKMHCERCAALCAAAQVGRIAKHLSQRHFNVIRVEVPLAQMFGYATDLRSRTQGRATFTMHFSHYAELPAALAEEVIKKHRGEK